MKHQKQNHSFLVEINHGIVNGILLFIFTLPFTMGQKSPLPMPPPPPSNQFSMGPTFNPTMAILMVVIVSAFFLMAFLSLYVRRCADRRFGRPAATSTVVMGEGRRSRRVAVGLDPEVIERFPSFLYSRVKGLKIGKGSLECAVCLNEFEDDQTLRLIPKCSHVFHPDCIDVWLASHTTCPVCRANLVPKPGDLPFASVHMFEAEDNSVEPDRMSNINDEALNHVQIQVTDDGDDHQSTEVPHTHYSGVSLLNQANQNRPPRSWSTGWRLSRLFPRSHSTGHSLVQPGENFDRFTLRLPEEVRSQLMKAHLNRTKSLVAFPRAKSSRRGFRSGSLGSARGGNNFYYERFDQNEGTDRRAFSVNPPFISRTGSVRSSKGVDGGNEVNAIPSKNFLKSVRSPFDRLFLVGMDNNNNNNINIGEQSSGRLKPESHV